LHAEARPDTKLLQDAVDDFMNRFDTVEEKVGREGRKEGRKPSLSLVLSSTLLFPSFPCLPSQAASDLKAAKSVVDADGFTLVTRKSRAATVSDRESRNQKKKRKRGAVEKPDFYRFQMRDTKLSRLQSLRERFEVDKARVKRVQSRKGFKL
jgi:hypothetical protein